MKKKKTKKFIVILVCILILLGLILTSQNESKADTSKIIKTNQENAEVSKQTIATTLTASGEVESATLEKIALNTNYYYLTMCVEKNELVKEGSNLL